MTAFIDLFLATYFPWLFALLMLAGVVKIFKPGLNKIYNYRVKVLNDSRSASGAGGGSQLMKYDSALEVVTSMEAGLVMEMDHVGTELKKAGKEPMDEKSYQIMITQLHKIQSYKQKLANNPAYMIADTILFPIGKALIPDLERAGKKLLRGVGEIGEF